VVVLMSGKLIVIMLLLLFCVGTAHAELTDDLISYYKFDETSGTTLSDELDNYNLDTTNVTINQTGKINKSILTTDTKETGIDYIEEITVSFWYKSNGQVGKVYVIPLTSNKFNQFKIKEIDDTTIKFTTIAQGIAVRYDSGNITVPSLSSNWIYINMKYVKSSNTIYWQWNNNTGSGNAGNLNGTKNPEENSLKEDSFYDELGIWSRALTSDEITELYNSGSGLTYPFVGIFADFTYDLNNISMKANLWDDSYVVGETYTINDWNWLVDDVSISTDQNNYLGRY